MGKWGFFDERLSYFRAKEVIRHLRKGSVLLDIGCGYPPRFLALLLEKGFIRQGYGIDRKVPRGKYKEQIELFKIDLEDEEDGNIPLPTESVDVVTMLAVLEHLVDPTKVLKEIHRVLKTEGLFILTTPAPLAKPVLDILAYLRIIDPDEIKDHKRYYSKDSLIDLVKENGFIVTHHRYFELYMNQVLISMKGLTKKV